MFLCQTVYFTIHKVFVISIINVSIFPKILFGRLPANLRNLNALFAEAHPDAVLAIVDKVDEQRVPGKQRLWVWGDAGFLK